MSTILTMRSVCISTCLRFVIQAGLLNTLAAAPIGHAEESDLSPVDYLRQVEPILKKNCYPCHGAQVQTKGLRLDSKKDAWRGGDSGRPLIVPGKSSESLLLKVISTSGSDSLKRMPPPRPPGRDRYSPDPSLDR